MVDTTTKKVQEYKDSLKLKAEQLIIKDFPEKIVKLNEILDRPGFSNRNLADVHVDLKIPIPDPVLIGQVTNDERNEPMAKKIKLSNNIEDKNDVAGTKVMTLPTGMSPCNAHISELISIVKPYIRTLLEDANLLKMWISFMIPKIEDGNNFGVSIQEDTLAEVQAVETEAAAFFDQISRYFLSRAKIISKVAKYPHLEDYRRAVQELDEKEYISLWLVMCEIRNRYSSLHDIVIKNLEKIKKPRSSNTESLY